MPGRLEGVKSVLDDYSEFNMPLESNMIYFDLWNGVEINPISDSIYLNIHHIGSIIETPLVQDKVKYLMDLQQAEPLYEHIIGRPDEWIVHEKALKSAIEYSYRLNSHPTFTTKLISVSVVNKTFRSKHIWRGGWRTQPYVSRVKYFLIYPGLDRASTIGFRCVKSPGS